MILTMQLNIEIKTSLKREYSLCTHAVAFYKKSLREFEQKYHLTTSAFLKKFEAGRMGDASDFFDWYAFAKLLTRWQKTRSTIQSTVR
jgi:hypothetical protein